jgi:Reverse transcriptase (RNA-dependent DNA polymerase)
MRLNKRKRFGWRALLERLMGEPANASLGFSYGFRPGRGAHDALDALAAGIIGKKVNWVLDADIRGFVDTIDHGWLIKFIEHRIADLWVQQWRQRHGHGDIIIVRYADDGGRSTCSASGRPYRDPSEKKPTRDLSMTLRRPAG